MSTLLRIATRGSALALWQAEMVAGRLRQAAPDTLVELVIVKTTGDIRQDVALSAMAGKGVFVREIESALLQGEADVAVHSAKDLPSTDTPGLTLAAFCERADPRDALVSGGVRWADLPQGATVATSAPRRIAQLMHARPDLRFIDIRGNVDTRLAKRERGDANALVLACAGLDRLGRGEAITERLPVSLSLPQVGQGCVAVQCRADDISTISLVGAACDHSHTREAVTTERAFLALIGGGCTIPVAAHATTSENHLLLTARVLAPDGSQLLEAAHQVGRGQDTERGAAQTVYENLIAQGAARLLALTGAA